MASGWGHGLQENSYWPSIIYLCILVVNQVVRLLFPFFFERWPIQRGHLTRDSAHTSVCCA
jgi:hypothetical protein